MGTTLNPGIPDGKGKKGAEKRGYYGMAKGGSLGKLRDLSHPPIAVQSLHSSIISVFVESYSHSHRRRFSSGSENHARSRLRHPLSAPESRMKSLSRVQTLSDPMDCSPPSSSIHGIFQAGILEWGAIAFSGGYVGCIYICNCYIFLD